MRTFLQALAVMIFLLVPVTVSLALPVSNAGGARCQCRCGNSNDGKDIDWLKTPKQCSLSDGKDCTFTNNGKTQKGTLRNCEECRPGSTSTEWRCGGAAISRSPTGTLQRTPVQGPGILPPANTPTTAPR